MKKPKKPAPSKEKAKMVSDSVKKKIAQYASVFLKHLGEAILTTLFTSVREALNAKKKRKGKKKRGNRGVDV